MRNCTPAERAAFYDQLMELRGDRLLPEDLCVLIIDLEATCDEDGGIPTDEMEIIEIGTVWARADGYVLGSKRW